MEVVWPHSWPSLCLVALWVAPGGLTCDGVAEWHDVILLLEERQSLVVFSGPLNIVPQRVNN